MTEGLAFDGLGPFVAGLDPARRLTRLRRMRATVPARHNVARTWLYLASLDPSALPGSLAALNALPTLDHRHILSRFGAS
jgi:hypothetical protein